MMKTVIRIVAAIAFVLLAMTAGAFVVVYYGLGNLTLASHLQTFASICGIAFIPELIVDGHEFFG